MGYECDDSCLSSVYAADIGGGSYEGETMVDIVGIGSFDGATACAGSPCYDPYTVDFCAADGDYTILLGDSYGDSWNGNTIVMRLQEDCIISGKKIPKYSMLSGKVSFGSERLNINITRFKSKGEYVDCDLKIYDNDGYLGLHVPNGLGIGEDAVNDGVSAGESVVRIPGIGNIGTNALKKKMKDPSVRVYDGHQITIRK